MVNPPRSRGYPDLKYKFIRGLIKGEHQQRRHQFLKQAAEWTSKAIVSLSLTEEPVRSTKQATKLEGIGPTIRARLDQILKDNWISDEPPLPGRHISTGSGLLVALLNESEALGSSEGGKPLVLEDDLKKACSDICDEKFNSIKPSSDGTPVMCPAWWRINVLISRGYIKKKTRGKNPVYELLPDGEEVALRVRGEHIPPPRVRPALPASGKTPSKKSKTDKQYKNSGSASPVKSGTVDHHGPLYSSDTGTDGVVMLVDNHELGGDGVRLGELSRRLKDWGVTHKTCALPCGDYQWVWRQKGKEVTLPIIVERKRADDLAESIKDGRYIRQKDKMLEWRSEFGILTDEVSLQYILESTPEAYRVSCMDGCNGVGKCGNPSVQQLQVAIEELRNNTDFMLIQTENIEISVEYLATITADLQRRVTLGDFDTLRLIHSNRSCTSTGLHKLPALKTTKPSPSSSSVNSYSAKGRSSATSTMRYDEFNSPPKRKSDLALCSTKYDKSATSARSATSVNSSSTPYSNWLEEDFDSPSNELKGETFPYSSSSKNRQSETFMRSAPNSAYSTTPKMTTASERDYTSPASRKRAPYQAIDVDDLFDECTEKRARVESGYGLGFPESQGDDLLESVFDEPSSSHSGASSNRDYLKCFDAEYEHKDFQNNRDKSSRYSWKESDVKDHVLNPGRSRFAPSPVSSSPSSFPSKGGTPHCVKAEVSSIVREDEDKIRAVREVIPDCSRAAVLRALSSSGGNVDHAVMMLLDTPSAHSQAEFVDLT